MAVFCDRERHENGCCVLADDFVPRMETWPFREVFGDPVRRPSVREASIQFQEEIRLLSRRGQFDEVTAERLASRAGQLFNLVAFDLSWKPEEEEPDGS